MDDVLNGASGTNELIGQIALVSAELNQGIAQITLAVVELDGVTQQHAYL